VGTGVGEQLKGSATAGWLAVATVSAGGGHGVTLEGARRARQAAGQIEAPAVMRRPGAMATVRVALSDEADA
jgi:hypothetical protein